MNLLKVFSHDHPFYPIHITTNVIVTTFLAIVATVTTMIADYSIQGELALSDTETLWLTALNLLGINTIVPTSNWFAARFGYNRIYTMGITIFTLATLLAAISQNFTTLAAARFIEGVGGGFIFPVGLALIVKSAPKEKLGLFINLYIGIAFGLGLGLGIYISGMVTQFLSWRDLFFMLIPIAALSSFSCWLCRKPNPETTNTPFDFFGFSLFACFIAFLLIALALAPIPSTNEGFREPYIIGLIATAIVCFIAFLFTEMRSANPLFDLSLFKNSIFSAGVLAMFLLGASIFPSISVSIKYMLQGIGYEKFTAGKVAAIYGLSMGTFSIISSMLAKRLPIPILTFSGLSILIFSFFANNELSWLTGYQQVGFLLFLRGAGIGLALGPTTQLALSQIPDDRQSYAATMLTFFRQVGGTYGGILIAIISIRRAIFHTAIFAERVNGHLPAYKTTFYKLTNQYHKPIFSKEAIIENLETQAYIQGLNDAFIVLGYLISFVAVLLFFLLLFSFLKKRAANPR